VTTAKGCSPQAPPRVLSGRTVRTYAADWALFVDWCEATDQEALPADPGTVVEFLAGCPAAVSTLRVRVTAIDHQHTATGYAPPGQSPVVLAALGRPVPGPYEPAPEIVAAVEAALKFLPSHGWTNGMFGRRDRCLLVLSQLAGVPYRHLATLTVGDITLTGVATISTAAGTWTMPPADDPVVCGPCAVVRWLRVLNLAATKYVTGVIATALDEAEAVTSESPHLCRSTRPLDPKTLEVAVLAPINQWGALPDRHSSLSPHGQSRRTRDILAGDLAVHRDIPVSRDEPAPEAIAPVGAPPPGSVFDRAASRRAWAKRRNDLDQLGDVSDVLAELDRQIAELQHRVTALLDSETT
jgi:hypothetical protein